MDKKSIRGQNLKELRIKKGLKQFELANFLEITPQAYQKYEYGTAEPNYDSLCKLADFYGVTTDYILGREEQSNPIAKISDVELEQEFLQLYFKLIPSQLRLKVWEQLAENLQKQIDQSNSTNDVYIIQYTTFDAELDSKRDKDENSETESNNTE